MKNMSNQESETRSKHAEVIFLKNELKKATDALENLKKKTLQIKKQKH